MAVQLTSTGDKLTRSGSYLTITGAWTVGGWGIQSGTAPSGTHFRNYYTYGDTAYTTSYLRLASDIDSNVLRLAYFKAAGAVHVQTTASFTPTAGVYFSWAIRYDGVNALDFIINDAILETLTIDLSTITFATTDEMIGGNWTDFSSAQVGIWSASRTLHQILVQSHTPAPRGGTTSLSFTPLSGWNTSLTLIDQSGHSRPWTLTGAYTTTTSPMIPGPFPFDTTFADDLDDWTLRSWDLTADSSSGFLKPTLGCGYGELYTAACATSVIQLWLDSPPDNPASPAVFASSVTSLSLRMLGALYSTAGSVPDGTTGIDATLPPGTILAYFLNPRDTLGTLGSDEILLIVQSTGTLQLAIRIAGPAWHNVSSSAAAFPLDGLHHGLQVTLDFTSANHVTYMILVDNSIVLSGSYASALMSQVGMVQIRQSKDAITTGFYTAYSRIQMANIATVVNWPGCSDAQALSAAATICALGPRMNPIVPPTMTPASWRLHRFDLKPRAEETA